MTDAGTHVPLIASWQGTIAPGRVCDDLINFCDVLPTFVDVAGARRPDGVTIDGRSFAPQLFGEPGTPRDWVFIELGARRFVRDGRWKLHGDGRLYDMRADPFERTPCTRGRGRRSGRGAASPPGGDGPPGGRGGGRAERTARPAPGGEGFGRRKDDTHSGLSA